MLAQFPENYEQWIVKVGRNAAAIVNFYNFGYNAIT